MTEVHWWPVPKGDGPPMFDCSKLGGFDSAYCQIDRFEACALEAACPHEGSTPCTPSAQIRLIKLARCIEFEHNTDPTWNVPCANSTGFDAVALSACAADKGSGPGATKLMNYVYGVANSSTPVVTGFPDIRVNGKVMPNYWPNSVKEVEKALCDAYSGADRPSICGAL